MTGVEGDDVQNAFRALADPTRRAILSHLAEQEMTIGEVADRFDITRAAVKKHLIMLEDGQLISVEAVGRKRVNRLRPEGLKPVSEWISYFEQFWNQKLGALKGAIEQQGKKTK